MLVGQDGGTGLGGLGEMRFEPLGLNALLRPTSLNLSSGLFLVLCRVFLPFGESVLEPGRVRDCAIHGIEQHTVTSGIPISAFAGVNSK
jgi:hypothetical protein